MIHVLVVDDEKEQNQVICTYLMKNNIHAVGCTSAAQAYDVLFEGHFDLIIFDIMMPEIDGYEFAESIRRIDKNVPLLFISARDDIQSKVRGFHLNIDDYLVKPIDLDELLLRIHALLRLSVGVRFRSLWDIHLGTYYLLLCVIRWILQCGVSLTSSPVDVRRTYRRCHICGWLLLVLDLILSGMVFLMVFRDHTYDYPGMLIYLAALYTFYITISAGVHLIRDRRHQDPIVNAANILSLTAALVSMLALQTAMLTQFGDGSLSPSQMNAISGSAVCFGVLGLALLLIRSSHVHLQQTTQNRS